MSRAVWILAVLLSHWRRHPMQLATLLIGLISATALWSGVQALNQQARESYDRAARPFRRHYSRNCAVRAGRCRRCWKAACRSTVTPIVCSASSL
jgi:putative ABC transport system permease protein